MTYAVDILRAAQKRLARLARQDHPRIIAAIESRTPDGQGRHAQVPTPRRRGECARQRLHDEGRFNQDYVPAPRHIIAETWASQTGASIGSVGNA